MHVVVITPAETMEAVRSYPSIAISLPRTDSGSASALFFSRLAQRSLRLQPTCSRSRLNDPLRRRLQQLRCLYCCFGCYRVERTSSRAGQTPAEKHRLSRRTSAIAPAPARHTASAAAAKDQSISSASAPAQLRSVWIQVNPPQPSP